jgi:DNA mismatch repair protein MutS2
MGVIRSNVSVNDLELVHEKEDSEPANYIKSGKMRMDKSLQITPEINLIGKTSDEALALLDKYLDDAYLTHLPKVTVIHGMGTGTLRKTVQAHLKKLKYVKSYRLGEFGEGGTGVTIVEFNAN